MPSLNLVPSIHFLASSHPSFRFPIVLHHDQCLFHSHSSLAFFYLSIDADGKLPFFSVYFYSPFLIQSFSFLHLVVATTQRRSTQPHKHQHSHSQSIHEKAGGTSTATRTWSHISLPSLPTVFAITPLHSHFASKNLRCAVAASFVFVMIIHRIHFHSKFIRLQTLASNQLELNWKTQIDQLYGC